MASINFLSSSFIDNFTGGVHKLGDKIDVFFAGVSTFRIDGIFVGVDDLGTEIDAGVATSFDGFFVGVDAGVSIAFDFFAGGDIISFDDTFVLVNQSLLTGNNDW